jgi:anionic cell wall polymer biosynthesis LytR-Cps2A-Psr (LCP) family protein
MPGLIEELSQCVTTDVPATDAIAMLLKLQGMDTSTMYMATIPSYPNNHDGVSYVAADRDALNEMMNRVDQGLPPEDLADTAAQDQS